MKILVIGSGGREHALARAFARSARVSTVFVSPGNPGMRDVAQTIALNDFPAIADFALAQDVAFVFVGPEQPLADGLADYLQARNVRVVGPSQAAARIESSKAFAKDIMQRYGVPTAAYRIFENYETAADYLRSTTWPQVIKADGLAAGKGVTVARTFEEADAALRAIFQQKEFGETGVVIEEFLTGWEASIFAFTDGEHFAGTIFSQDHKPLLDGDLGPNTGGMGAYAPVKAAERWRDDVNELVFHRVLHGLRAEGCPFAGVLYAGLMMTDAGPRVIEFNCRFGDPETEVVLPLLKTDLVDVCEAILDKRIPYLHMAWEPGYAVGVMAASQGYPGSYRKGLPIEPGNDDEDTYLCYAGVKESEGALVTSGGRVLLAGGQGATLHQARKRAYDRLGRVHFDDMIYRSDIGAKGY